MSEMVARPNGADRQWLAWTFLIGGFFTCVILTIAAPLSLNAFVQNARRPLFASVQANQGTLQITDATGDRRAVLVGETGRAVAEGAALLTDGTATALLTIVAANEAQPLARLQIYSNAVINLTRADTPRFSISRQMQELQVALESGRLRLTLLESAERPSQVLITTPQGNITIQQPGEYSFEVNNQQTQVSVFEGMASVTAVPRTLLLAPNQRAEISTNGVLYGPLDTERNLIQNGDFNDGYEKWSLFAWNTEFVEQPKGEARLFSVDGEPGLRFFRDGVGHADGRVQQTIDQDVTDYQSLQLFLTFRIVGQSLGVCGVQGSECPLFIRMDYVDESGSGRTWQQGFYATGEVSETTPDFCIACALLQDEHQRVEAGQISFYAIDLRAELARLNSLPPRFIKNVYLIASGHALEVEVLDVALMAKE